MSKTLNQFLQETTVPPEYQHVADAWNHHSRVDDETQEKITRAMDKGSFTHFPLDGGMADADPDVVEHLNNHGWDIKDYQKGIAHKRTQVGNPSMGIPMREKVIEKKIGSILDETGASPDVKKTFINDRGQTNASQQHIVVSTSPLAILGMSTGTTWDNESCMNVPGGAHHDYLKNDSENGTHVAYLVNSDDHSAFNHGEPDKPLARIALKPYHYEDQDTGDVDTIFRPENRSYGSGSNAFTRAVSNWSVKNYPAIKNVEYVKNRDVYDDTGNDTYTSMDKQEMEGHIDDAFPISNAGASIDHDIIEHGIKHLINSAKDRQDRANYLTPRIKVLSGIGNLSTNHVAKLYKLSEEATNHSGESATKELRRNLAINHGDKFSTNALRELWNNSENKNDFPPLAISSTKLPDEIVDELPVNKYKFVRQKKIKDKHINKAIDAYNNGEYNSRYPLVEFKNKLSIDHINKLIDGQKHLEKLNDVYSTFSDSDNFNQDHYNKIMKKLNIFTTSGNQDLRAENHIKNTIASTSKFAKLDEFKDRLGNLIENRNLPEEETLKIKNEVMNRAMSHVHVKKNQWDSDNPGFSGIQGVRRLFNSNLIPEHISKHMTDEDFSNIASKRFNVNFENADHSNKYLDKIAGHALDIDNAINDHIEHKMSTQDEYDPDEDDDVQKMKGNLNLHMEAYANNIGNHISDHVGDEYGDVIKNFKEHQKTSDRISGVGKTSLSYFDHYMSPHHSDYDWRSDVDHYNDHFEEHDEKLNKLENRHDD